MGTSFNVIRILALGLGIGWFYNKVNPVSAQTSSPVQAAPVDR
jgi:hypothetical protein